MNVGGAESMDDTLHFYRRWATVFLVACLLQGRARPCTAGDIEQAQLLEKAATQFEELNSAASALVSILERVKDGPSADAVVEQMEPAAKKFVAKLEAIATTLESEALLPANMQFTTQEFLERAQAAIAKKAALQVVWRKQAARYAAEVKRIQGLEGLSVRFRDIFNAQTQSAEPAIRKAGIDLSETSPIAGVPTLFGMPQAYEQAVARYGKNRVVRVEITNIADIRRKGDELSDTTVVHTSFKGNCQESEPSEQIVSGFNPKSGVAWQAPVDDFDRFCKRIRFGEIVARSDAERVVKVKIDWSKMLGYGSGKKPRVVAVAKLLGVNEEVTEFPTADDPDYHKKLCILMVDEKRPPLSDQAIDALLDTKPDDIQDPAVRKQIAQNFRALAMSTVNPDAAEKAIQGLVLYGGKYSVPILIGLLKRNGPNVPAVIDGLAANPDPKGAEAVAALLANNSYRDAALGALREMGPVAEDALIRIAPSSNAEVSLAAVTLLGDVGTQKCTPMLAKAAQSTNREVLLAAKDSLKAVRERSKQPAVAAK
jgi:hypothetical protein